jgi:cation:H+ antiporter
LALLVIGGEALVSSAVAIAKHFRVPAVVIGATLVGFGTSTPELTTSVQAALNGSPEIAIGNVAGSNIANILLILAIVVIIYPVKADPKAITRDGVFNILASVILLTIAFLSTELSRPIGVMLLLGLVTYVVYTLWTELRGQAAEVAAVHSDAVETVPVMQRVHFAIPIFVVALAAVIFGADLLVKGAIDLARILGLSELVIGLTIVAVGTSLPELVASLIAAIKGRSDVALGNIFGSGIFNIFGILGITAIVSPIPLPPELASRDGLWVLGTAVALLAACLLLKGVGRLMGFGFLAAYVFYTYLLLQSGQVPTV